MSSAVSFGTNVNAKRKRVYYEGSDTIYEGYALCYNWDTTSNILGVDRADGSKSSTTTAGSKNEGKFLRVEKPATANFFAFAGVVAPGSWCGKAGPMWLEIYVPNGAIVPVYTDKSITAGDKMYLENAQYTIINTESAGAYIGEACDTIDRSSTAGLVQVKLIDPCFNQRVDDLFQTHLSDAWTAFSNAIPTQTFNDADVSALASDMNARWADLLAAISDFTVVLSDAGLV